MKKVGIIMGSDSDFPTVQAAVKQLKALEIPFEVHVYSAHRTPDAAHDFAQNARDNGFGVIIAAAGMAAPLRSRVAGMPFSSSSRWRFFARVSPPQSTSTALPEER